MLDPYLEQLIAPDATTVTFDTRDIVRLQDALNRIEEQEGIELWRTWTQRQRQNFFFLAGRVEDLETWMRIAKLTWIAAMRSEFNTNINEIEDKTNRAFAQRSAELDVREREITLSVSAALRIQQANTSLSNELEQRDAEIAELLHQINQKELMIGAARRLANAISELQAADNFQ
jgi:hypothetical protein